MTQTTAITESEVASVTHPADRLSPPPRSFSLLATGDVLTESLVMSAAARAAGNSARYDFAPLFAPIAAAPLRTTATTWRNPVSQRRCPLSRPPA